MKNWAAVWTYGLHVERENTLNLDRKKFFCSFGLSVLF